MNAFDWPERVTLREVGLRDGLQSISRTLPTDCLLYTSDAADD